MEDKEIRNKVIAISGEPVSGKGTTVKILIEKLKQKGYTAEQIHKQCTGDEFRKYSNCVVGFIKNLNNPEKLKEIIKKPEIRDFFNNKQYRKLLVKTIIELRDANIDLSKFTIKQANDLEEFAGVRHVIDTLIDTRMKTKGEQINQEQHPHDIWIIDSRLAFANIPEAFSVRLTANSKVAGERLFNDKSRGVEDSEYETVEDAIKEREARKEGEKKRYLKRYNVDLEDENNYDLIIDTSYSTVEDIANTILECSRLYYEDKEFGKNWTSPKTLLPLQSERETLSPTLSGVSLEQLAENIKQEGYHPKNIIEAVNVDGINYIIEGHHRNFAMAHIGKTLVPYAVIAKDDEVISKYGNTARDRANSIKKEYLTGHEWMIDKKFSYKEIYPDIYEKAEQLEGEYR